MSNDIYSPYVRPMFADRERGAAAWLRQRGIPLMAAVGVQVLIVVVIAAQKIEIDKRVLAPLSVSFIEAPTTREYLPPPKLPDFEAPPVSIIAPEIIVAEEPAPSAITAAVAATSPTTVSNASKQEPIVEARFDVDYLNNPQPAYPAISKRMREEGLVVLKVKVRADGTPDVVHVHRHSGSVRLDEAALAAVRHWKFVPAKRGNQVVESWVLVPIEFELKA